MGGRDQTEGVGGGGGGGEDRLSEPDALDGANQDELSSRTAGPQPHRRAHRARGDARRPSQAHAGGVGDDARGARQAGQEGREESHEEGCQEEDREEGREERRQEDSEKKDRTKEDCALTTHDVTRSAGSLLGGRRSGDPARRGGSKDFPDSHRRAAARARPEARDVRCAQAARGRQRWLRHQLPGARAWRDGRQPARRHGLLPVEKTPFDHTSLLKYLMDKWHLGPLGARTDTANSISVAFKESAPRTDTPAFIRVPYTDLMPQRPELERYDVSRHDEAITAFASFLAREEEAISADVVSALPFEAALL